MRLKNVSIASRFCRMRLDGIYHLHISSHAVTTAGGGRGGSVGAGREHRLMTSHRWAGAAAAVVDMLLLLLPNRRAVVSGITIALNIDAKSGKFIKRSVNVTLWR